MKRLLITVLSCWLLASGLEAAPPLRRLMPMQLNDGTIINISERIETATAEDYCCASQMAVSKGRYLQHMGTPHILTILAAFPDQDFTINMLGQAFNQYLNGDSLVDLGNRNKMNQASVRQYFETCSRGKFSPQFDVVGPVTVPQNMRYYGGSNSNNSSDERFSPFCQDVMEQAKELVSDWSKYDNDGDGNIELVCIIYAGFGQNQGGADSTLWAKASYQNKKLNDSLHISYFNCSPELFHPQRPDWINGIGVFIHEFSHCMGLPDLYHTRGKYANNQDMESFSIMDYGLYNNNSFAPCAYTAWEQEAMGWTEIEPIDSEQVTTDRILPLIEGGKAYKIVNSNNERDYIIMENIQKRGLNTSSKGHGLLVYHVDYPYFNINMSDSPNNNIGHPSVAIVPASGVFYNTGLVKEGGPYTRSEWTMNMAAAPFPGTQNVTSLYDQMQTPNYCFYDNDSICPTGFILSNITEDKETGNVSFTVCKESLSGIDTARSNKDESKSPLYDLQGRKIHGNIKPGIYIKNGKKILTTKAVNIFYN